MNKKGLLAVIVIIIVIIAGYKFMGGSSTVNNTGETPTVIPEGVTKDTYAPVTKDTVDTSLLGRLKSASVAASEDGTRVAFVNGTAQFTADGVKGSVTLGDIAIAKKIGTTDYAVTTFGVTSGKTTSQYAVLFLDSNGTLTDKSYALIGVGAKITGLRADDVADGTVVSVSYKGDDGKAHTKILVIEKGEFNGAKQIDL